MARILITSALPYINGIKHLGNLAGSMLPADVYARFRRLPGHEVLFICATDEHGTPAELAAAEPGQTSATIATSSTRSRSACGQGFSLSFDWFGRSSNPPNHELTQHFAEVLEKNGLIEERIVEADLFDRRQALPARPLCRRHLPELRLREGARRSVRQLRDAARPDRPDESVLDPSPARRNVEIRDTRHLFLLQTEDAGRSPQLGRQRASRLAAPRARRSPTNGSTKA